MVTATKLPPPKVFNSELTQCWQALQGSRRVAIYRCLIDITGSLKAAALLSQLIYWTRVSKEVAERDGWIFKSIAQMEAETGLTVREQRTCKIRLLDTNLIQTCRKGVGAALAIKVNLDTMAEMIAKFSGTDDQFGLTLADLQNTSKLTDNNIISPNAKRMAKAKLQSASADYKLAVLHKKLALIRAPFTGVLGRIPQKVGSFIQQDDLLTTLSDNSQMQVYFNISETDYLDFQQHPDLYTQLPLKLLLANGSTFPAQGHIKDISGQFDNATGTISVRSLFANPKGLLRNGQTGTVQLLVRKNHAMIIPQEAVYELQDRKYVFVIDKNNVIHQRQIQIAAEATGIYVIASGLNASDHYLTDGIQKVNDGDRVRTRFVNPRQAIKSNEITI